MIVRNGIRIGWLGECLFWSFKVIVILSTPLIIEKEEGREAAEGSLKAV